MGELIPTTRQVKRKDGTTYQAIRHLRAPGSDSPKKGWTPPQVTSAGSDQLVFEHIHNSLSRRGISDANISFVLDTAMNNDGLPALSLSSTKALSALNDCFDALGEEDFSFADEETQVVAKRIIIASLHQLPSNQRVKKMVQDPNIDLDRLISYINDDGINDPAKLEVLFDGGSKALSDGAL